jgi:hypothetical protein
VACGIGEYPKAVLVFGREPAGAALGYLPARHSFVFAAGLFARLLFTLSSYRSAVAAHGLGR